MIIPAGPPGSLGSSRTLPTKIIAAIAILLLASCAEIAPPPGGPPDLIAPRILGASPESLASGVDPSAPFLVTFSERVVKDRFNDWIFIRPFRRIDRVNWKGNAASLTVRGGWPVDSTVTITIGTGVSDRNRNRMPEPFRRTFSTGVRVDPGVLAGEVRRTRTAGTTTVGGTTTGRAGVPSLPLPGSGTGTGPSAAIFAWVYHATADTLPDLARDDPDYLTEVSPNGRFRLEGLPVGIPLRLFVLFDSDLSRTFTPGRDFATLYPDTLRLSEADPAIEGLSILLLDPKSPGSVTGVLSGPADTAQVDTLSYGVLLSETRTGSDSTAAWPPARARYAGMVGKNGAFLIRSVAAGSYRAAVFIDADRNGQWSPLEILGRPVELTVRPDEETGGLELARPE